MNPESKASDVLRAMENMEARLNRRIDLLATRIYRMETALKAEIEESTRSISKEISDSCSVTKLASVTPQ